MSGSIVEAIIIVVVNTIRVLSISIIIYIVFIYL